MMLNNFPPPRPKYDHSFIGLTKNHKNTWQIICFGNALGEKLGKSALNLDDIQTVYIFCVLL